MNLYDISNIFSLIQKENPFNPDKALNIYMYGSYVYGTNGDKSDQDIIMVSDIAEDLVQFNSFGISCSVYSIYEFEARLAEEDISCLECIYLPNNFILRNKRPYASGTDVYPNGHEIDLQQLRKHISEKASNSYVKAKKKFTVEALNRKTASGKEHEIYLGKKSLFHSLRIPMFGTEIARLGKIVNYSIANQYWFDIVKDTSTDWEHYNKKYKQEFNKLMSDFRLVAPKIKG